MLTGPPVTKTVGHVSQFTLGLASDRQTPEAQLAPAGLFLSLDPLTTVKVVEGVPQRLVTRTRQLFGVGSFW